MQTGVEFALLLHALPHAPQCCVLPEVSTQLPPQVVCGATHPLLHVIVAPSHTGVAPEHARPHAPQLAAVRTLVSQPFAMFPSQSAQPALQLYAHAPTLQRAVALARTAHGEQPPHVLTEDIVSASQPLASTPSQLAKPEMQLNEQRPAAQARVALGRSAHATPHAPQWSMLRAVSTQLPLQSIVPIHASTQRAGEATVSHTKPALQRAAHAPQLSVVVIAVSQPLRASPSQSE